MEYHHTSAASVGNAETIPGAKYPELVVDAYGGVRHRRCIEHLSVSFARSLGEPR